MVLLSTHNICFGREIRKHFSVTYSCLCACFQHTYEDSMDMIAKLPTVAAIIYRNLYRDGTSVGTIDPAKDWSWNFAEMLSYESTQFVELMRLYLTIHRCVLLHY